jgi:hypothetical protein
MLFKVSVIAIRLVLALFLATSILASTVHAQSGQDQQKPAASSEKPQATPPTRSHYQPNRFSRRANLYYSQIWGVDSLAVKTAESGELVRFTYRVLDANKAKALNDKKVEPSLIDPQAGVKLVVPSLEKVGQLRQSSPPEAGKMYWMAFSNKGRHVKPGHHVNIIIGNFRAEGLVVQ